MMWCKRLVSRRGCTRIRIARKRAFKSWFYRIAVNQALIYRRSMKGKWSVMGHSGPLSDALIQVQQNPEARCIKLEARQHLADKIKHLTPKPRRELLRFMVADKGDPLNQDNVRKSRRLRPMTKLRQ